MSDGVIILIYPLVIIPVLSMLLACAIDYFRKSVLQRRQRRMQIHYLLMVRLSFNEQELPPAYESLFF
jgi:hypothetical protein